MNDVHKLSVHNQQKQYHELTAAFLNSSIAHRATEILAIKVTPTGAKTAQTFAGIEVSPGFVKVEAATCTYSYIVHIWDCSDILHFALFKSSCVKLFSSFYAMRATMSLTM